MIHYNYSKAQLEQTASELLCQFDPERVGKAKPIDVYAVIEKCLDVPYDWKYITPDQSILGLTFFRPGYYWMWPEPWYEDGMRPEKKYYDTGTIVIDATLTESDNPGRENFTVMHEVFHQVLHKKCFAHSKTESIHKTCKENLNFDGKKKFTTSLEICEWQANYCAACFLMPREAVVGTLYKMNGGGKRLTLGRLRDEAILCDMATEFNVSNTAMKIRLKELNLTEQ